ncbi:cupin domain-containing protein [Nitrospinota bacterium]
MAFYDLNEMEAEKQDGSQRKVLQGKNLTLVFIERDPNFVQEHSHPHEQMVCLMEGKMKVRLGDEEREIEAGQVVHIPGDMSHRIETLTSARIISIYSPPRGATP